MGPMASQITSLTIVNSTVYSCADQSEHQSSASLAFVGGIHRGPVNSLHKRPVTRKMFPFDDVIMELETHGCVLCTVATDALVLKHQDISIHSAEQMSIALNQFQPKILY